MACSGAGRAGVAVKRVCAGGPLAGKIFPVLYESVPHQIIESISRCRYRINGVEIAFNLPADLISGVTAGFRDLIILINQQNVLCNKDGEKKLL